MSPKCRKGCIDKFSQPPPLKGHKCPFHKASQAQPTHTLDESRPSKRQKTQSYVSGPPGDLTHVISPVDPEIVSVPGLLHTLPVFDAISPAASSSMMSSDDGIEPTTNSESNNGDINFDDFLRFLDGYAAESLEQDKMSGPPGWYSLEDLLDSDVASNLMQGVTDGSLSGNEVELDVLEDAGITLELNSGDMNACMTTELSSKDTNVHGADITPELSAGHVDCDVLTHASCPAAKPDQIVDGRYCLSDLMSVDDVAEDVAPPLQY